MLARIAMVLMVVFVVSCSGSPPRQIADERDAVVSKSADHIVSRVGLNFYSAYFVYEAAWYQRGSDSWVVYYKVKCPADMGFEALAKVRVSDEAPIQSIIPNCVEDPGECEVLIGSAQALEITLGSTVSRASGSWWPEFSIDSESGGFVWIVAGIEQFSDGTRQWRDIVVDANSGAVIRTEYVDENRRAAN